MQSWSKPNSRDDHCSAHEDRLQTQAVDLASDRAGGVGGDRRRHPLLVFRRRGPCGVDLEETASAIDDGTATASRPASTGPGLWTPRWGNSP